MADEILIKAGTPIVLADLTDHAPANANNIGTRTDQIDLTSLGAGAYRQSAKIDFGTPRGKQWLCRAAIEFASAPAAGVTIDIYVAQSNSATAANGNTAGTSGSDAAYTGYDSTSSDADEAVVQATYIGSLVATADTDVQVADIGIFIPMMQWGNVIVKNGAGVALAGDAVEMSVVFEEVDDQYQSA